MDQQYYNNIDLVAKIGEIVITNNFTDDNN